MYMNDENTATTTTTKLASYRRTDMDTNDQPEAAGPPGEAITIFHLDPEVPLRGHVLFDMDAGQTR